MAGEAIGFKTAWTARWEALHPAVTAEVKLTGGRQFLGTDSTKLRTGPAVTPFVFFQAVAIEGGVLNADDSNVSTVVIDFNIDFWRRRFSQFGEFELNEQEAWTSGLTFTNGSFYNPIHELIDPGWWMDTSFGNPSGLHQEIIRDPVWTETTEFVGGIYHAAINLALTVPVIP